MLGWSGTPGSKFWDTDGHNSVLYVNNSMGFRDIEHEPLSNKPAIVFLGGSYPAGAYVKFDEIFVELLRHKLTNYELYNNSFDCYGPDQDLLSFKNWQDQYKGRIKLVILMVSDEDVRRDNVSFVCGMPKPKFEIVRNKLVPTGVPVPMSSIWQRKESDQQLTKMRIWKNSIKTLLFNSYFLHAIYDRYAYFRNFRQEYHVQTEEDLTITSKILEELKKTVEAREAKLVIFFIPSEVNVENLFDSKPYQEKIKPICVKLGITCIDLLPDFKKSTRRTYNHLYGGHWNPYGHKVAAEAIYNFLINDDGLKLQSNNIKSN
ncbi:MAG: hypothetical protein ACHQ6U_00670 [Thermodesulfobacteriota bacterium]